MILRGIGVKVIRHKHFHIGEVRPGFGQEIQSGGRVIGGIADFFCLWRIDWAKAYNFGDIGPGRKPAILKVSLHAEKYPSNGQTAIS